MTADRKEAIKQYKSRTVARGIFAVRCIATGQVWVGSTPNLATINGLLFTLRQGSHRNVALQAAWNEHGEQSIESEIVETLDEDVPELAVRDLLKKRKQHWIEQLGAAAL
jgi:hypothetical protein